MIGSLIIIVGLSLISINLYQNRSFENKEQIFVDAFLINEIEKIETQKVSDKSTIEESYIAVIEIPSIKLRSGLVAPNSRENNVNKHIEIMKPYAMPDLEGGNFILAGHSGSGRAAYFKNLIKVKINDSIYITYKGVKYHYKVMNINNQLKNGTISITRNQAKTTLTLTTCNNTNKRKKQQLIVIAELIDKVKIGGET